MNAVNKEVSTKQRTKNVRHEHASNTKTVFVHVNNNASKLSKLTYSFWRHNIEADQQENQMWQRWLTKLTTTTIYDRRLAAEETGHLSHCILYSVPLSWPLLGWSKSAISNLTSCFHKVIKRQSNQKIFPPHHLPNQELHNKQTWVVSGSNIAA